jgi:hypothetical protein
MIKHRHGQQFGRRDEAGEGRQPEVEPQRRENDEDEIGKGHHEAERLYLAHVLDMHRQRDRGQRGFDQRADVPPDDGNVAVKLQVPPEHRMHPKLEQDERRQDHVEVTQPELAAPDMVQRFGRHQVDGPENDEETRGGGDEGSDPHQLGSQHFARQCMVELGGCRRPLLRFMAVP